MGHAACISCGDSLHGGLDGGDALAHLTGALVPLGLRIKHWRGRIDECAVGALPAAARSIPMTPRELCDLRGAFPELGLERPGLWCSALLRQSIHMRASESRGGRLCLMSRLWSEFHLLDLLLDLLLDVLLLDVLLLDVLLVRELRAHHGPVHLPHRVEALPAARLVRVRRVAIRRAAVVVHAH